MSDNDKDAMALAREWNDYWRAQNETGLVNFTDKIIARIAELEAALRSVGANRYWEGRWRNEAARVVELEAERNERGEEIGRLDKLLRRFNGCIAELEADAHHAPGWQLVHKLEAERDNAEIAYDELKVAYNDVFAQLRRAEAELDRLRPALTEISISYVGRFAIPADHITWAIWRARAALMGGDPHEESDSHERHQLAEMAENNGGERLATPSVSVYAITEAGMPVLISVYPKPTQITEKLTIVSREQWLAAGGVEAKETT